LQSFKQQLAKVPSANQVISYRHSLHFRRIKPYPTASARRNLTSVGYPHIRTSIFNSYFIVGFACKFILA